MRFQEIKDDISENPRKWLITGVAGFIGSNLLEELLNLNQQVVGIDNFSTGSKRNIEQVKSAVPKKLWENFTFKECDITNFIDCNTLTKNIDYVLHQAALGSVPRSIKDPINSNNSNVNGFLNMMYASNVNGVKRFVFASSSSVYGDDKNLPKKEDIFGDPLSPYALTKRINEEYAKVIKKTYETSDYIGLRYFNVFGKRQDPGGAYAAVIPKWINLLYSGNDCEIYGDGKTSRDFCYIDNVVQANILSATVSDDEALNRIYNIAVGDKISLNEIYKEIVSALNKNGFRINKKPHYRDFRAGDIRHTHADISDAKRFLGYSPTHNLSEGLEDTIKWYLKNL